jgi:hypothetical protein
MRTFIGSARSVGSVVVLLVVAGLGAGCVSQSDEPAEPVEAIEASLRVAPGALVDASIRSRVGVVLDEIPRDLRARAAAFYLAQPMSFWLTRAKQQLRHTNYRLIYRDFFYDPSENRRMMALPPEDLWNIDFGSPAPRHVITRDGHDAVEISYTMRTTILTDAASPGATEPNLKRVGGQWDEPFDLPLDPEFLFQRTGFACMDESGYPPNTAESENAYQLFDQDCDVETPDESVCHVTQFPGVSCMDALAHRVGRVDTALHLARVPYTEAAARRVRLGTFTHADAPDLAVLQDKLANNWVEYRYIPPDSCAISEQCVGGPGWRRLLLFDAAIQNRGALPLSVGSTAPDSPAFQHNVFEFSACHGHYHFRHYGDFSYGTIPGDKRAFCVESTNRYFNNEQTPLAHDFSCDNQGVAVGWGDTYIAGVECNWIDVTDLAVPPVGVTQDLRFILNPDNFLCEGTPVVDAQGNPVYEPTSFVTETGAPVSRPVCDFTSGYASNNTGTRPVKLLEAGGLVTAACTRQQAGPLRDCGFVKQRDDIACTPGKKVRLTCRVDDGKPDQVLRVCENSAKLGGIACMYSAALANTTVGDRGTAVSFTCPAARDASEPGGTFSAYVAPVLPTDAPVRVLCTPG